MAFAGPNYYRGQYEFQCLHGMGEPLYEEVVGRDKLDRPARVYAPVGSHETLLAYLVRRLLENGANTSFVNRIADETVSLADLTADPVEVARAIQPARRAARAHRPAAGALRAGAAQFAGARSFQRHRAVAPRRRRSPPRPAFPKREAATRGRTRPPSRVTNPADRSDVVGRVVFAARAEIEAALARAEAAAPAWAQTSAGERAAMLRRAADAFEMRATGSSGWPCAKPASPTPTPSPRCARPSISCAITRRRRAICSAPARPAPLGADRLHQPLELPARHLHRPDRGGAGGRQCRARQARRGDAADRRRGRAAAA